jgi:hypothetical protein
MISLVLWNLTAVFPATSDTMMASSGDSSGGVKILQQSRRCLL